MSNKQGPPDLVHSGGSLGGLSQVTTAFFKVRFKTSDFSYPGGGYQPFHAFPGKQMHKNRKGRLITRESVFSDTVSTWFVYLFVLCVSFALD